MKFLKREKRSIAIVLAILIVFTLGVNLGSNGINIGVSGDINVEKEGGAQVVAPVPTQAPTVAPSAPATPDASTPTVPTTPDTSAPATPNESAIPSTPEEVVARFNEKINALKKEQNITIVKTQNITFELLGGSFPSFLTSPLNGIISGLINPENATFDFTNAATADGADTVNGIVYPANKDCTLTADKVATATADGDGYILKLKLIAEKSAFGDGETQAPIGHQSCMDPLDLATIDASPAEITSADMDYPGADMEVTVDGSGKITSLHYYLPLGGEGNGKLMGITATLELGGDVDTTMEITYK